MPTVEDLLEKYQALSEEELFHIHQRIHEYSKEAQIALDKVIDSAGGIDQIQARRAAQKAIEDEEIRIRGEVSQLISEGNAKDAILKKLTSTLIELEEIENLTEDVIREVEKDKEDRKIKPRTIIGGLVGGILGGTIGGIIWGLQMIHSGKMFYIIAVGLVIISYGFVKLFTRQSSNNAAVTVLTILSTLYAFGLGFFLLAVFGISE